MRKFSKRSVAVLTTAAIMASSMSIVSYAVGEVTCEITFTVPTGATLTTETNDEAILTDAEYSAMTGPIADGSSGILLSGSRGAEGAAAVFTVTVTDDTKELDKVEFNGTPLTAVDGKYSITWQGENKTDGTFVITLKDKEENPDPSVTPNPTEPGEENFDQVVWVNGKDIKASKDGKTPASLYKTESYDQVMMSAGGKWQVAVTDATITDVDAFLKKFDTKGKFDAATAKASKEYASAKIKEGTVTVTAGKKAGNVNVWVYEVKSKAVVATEMEGNAFFGKFGDEVMPQFTEFTVKMAPSLTVSVADAEGKGKTEVDAETNTVKAVEKPEKLAKGYKAGDVVTAYLCDKKNAISLDATYVLWDGKDKKVAELKDGKLVGEGYTAELVDAADGAGPAVKITIADTATDKTKIDVQVKNVESGKIAKIAPKVAKVTAPKAASKVTVTFDATVTVKNGTADVKTGDQVKKDTTLTITPATATDVVSINGTAQDKAGEVTYKITGLEAEAKLTIAAAAPAAGTPDEGGEEEGGNEEGEGENS